jgi:hypothetical protein
VIKQDIVFSHCLNTTFQLHAVTSYICFPLHHSCDIYLNVIKQDIVFSHCLNTTFHLHAVASYICFPLHHPCDIYLNVIVQDIVFRHCCNLTCYPHAVTFVSILSLPTIFLVDLFIFYFMSSSILYVLIGSNVLVIHRGVELFYYNLKYNVLFHFIVVALIQITYILLLRGYSVVHHCLYSLF